MIFYDLQTNVFVGKFAAQALRDASAHAGESV